MRTFAPIGLPVPAPPADPALGRLGPVLARFPLSAVRTLTVESGSPTEPTGSACEGALERGAQRVDQMVDEGATSLVVEARSGHRRALAVLAALLDLEPIAAVGTAVDPHWAARMVAVRDLLPSLRPHARDPVLLLAAASDPALAELAGILAQAAVRRTPVLLDVTAPVAAAALLADLLAPSAAQWWLAATTPVAPAAVAALARLDLAPLLDLGVTRRGGALALALLRAAADG